MERVELDYTQRLFATRSTLAALPIELASSSRLPSPRSSSRSELLREKIAEAINTAKSDVTHPRWSHVSALIGMACTSRGYRGAADGVRIGEQNKVDVGGYEWLIPDTEKDWKYCERRWKARLQAKVKGKAVPSKYWKAVPANREVQEERLLSPSKRDLVWEKVESWKAKVVHEGDEVSPPASSVLDPALREGDTGQPSKRRTPLEFQVVKRHMPTTGSSKPAHKPQSLDLYEALATNRNTPEGNFLGGVNPHRPQNLLSPIPPTAPNIAELSEMVSMDTISCLLVLSRLSFAVFPAPFFSQ